MVVSKRRLPRLTSRKYKRTADRMCYQAAALMLTADWPNETLRNAGGAGSVRWRPPAARCCGGSRLAHVAALLGGAISYPESFLCRSNLPPFCFSSNLNFDFVCSLSLVLPAAVCLSPQFLSSATRPPNAGEARVTTIRPAKSRTILASSTLSRRSSAIAQI